MPKEYKKKKLANLNLLQMTENEKKKFLMQTMKDKHPKLIKGLNNPNQAIPAYMVFQS